ncbi:protein of unknown function [Pararobbsia alpina]
MGDDPDGIEARLRGGADWIVAMQLPVGAHHESDSLVI